MPPNPSPFATAYSGGSPLGPLGQVHPLGSAPPHTAPILHADMHHPEPVPHGRETIQFGTTGYLPQMPNQSPSAATSGVTPPGPQAQMPHPLGGVNTYAGVTPPVTQAQMPHSLGGGNCVPSGRAETSGVGRLPQAQVYRTPEAVSAECQKDEQSRAVEHGFSLGPLKITQQSLEQLVLRAATSLNFAGGGWGINKCRSDGHTVRNRGPRLSFGCHQRSSRVTSRRQGFGCKWEIGYELTTEGWQLFNYRADHKNKEGDFHPLMESGAEVMATGAARQIPVELHQLGSLLQSVGQSPILIFEALMRSAKDQELSTQFSYDDVLTKFPQSVNTRDWDATGLVEALQQRAARGEGAYMITTDQAGCIDKVFVQLDFSLDEWVRAGSENVLLFDPTHGSNQYKMKLCCFTTVGSSGQTVILAAALIKYEDVDQIMWAFKCFATLFKTPPTVVFTDGAQAIETAIQLLSTSGGYFESTSHLLCVFHLSKNFWQHIHPLFVSHPVEWRQAHNMFWRLAKTSDQFFADSVKLQEELGLDEDAVAGFIAKTFDVLWNDMFSMIERIGHGSTKTGALDWLTTLYDRRHKWAATFTWRLLTWGLHSTQRSEAIHSAIKRRKLLAGMNLSRLTSHLVEYNQEARANRAVETYRLSLRQLAASAITFPEVVSVRNQITPYAYELLLAQLAQALSYEYETTDLSDHSGAQYCRVRVVSGVQPDNEYTCEYDESTGEPGMYGHYADLGLYESSANLVLSHLTSLNTCTCNLHKSQYVPCRHTLMLRIRASQQRVGAQPMINLIGVKWHLRTDQEVAVAVSSMQKCQPCQTAPPQALALTRSDRMASLMEEFRSVAELCVRSPALYDAAMQRIPVFVKEILACSPSAPAPAVAPPTAAGLARASRSRPAAEIHPHIQRLLDTGDKFELLSDKEKPTWDFDLWNKSGRKWVGYHILFKWKAPLVRSSGYMLGRIERQIGQYTDEEVDNEDGEDSGEDSGEDDEDEDDSKDEDEDHDFNYQVHFPIDDSKVGVRLEIDDYKPLPSPQDPPNSWTFLKAASLGHDVEAMARAGTLHNPQASSKAGRKESKRKEPVAGGPTTKAYKGSAQAAKKRRKK